MRLVIPPAEKVVPGDEYQGFTLLPSVDPRAHAITELESQDVLLVWPQKALLHTERSVLNEQGIILGIGLAFALKKNLPAIPQSFKGAQYEEPVKIITSTRMVSKYDGRNYIAYFYIDAAGVPCMSFIAEKPWGSECPSPAIVA